MRSPRRIVLKSPPHTFRIKILLEMFPKARFLHIIRNPYVIFPSTINLWKRLYRNDGLQVPTYEGLDEHVFATFSRMYEVFERDRKLIPAGQFCEVRYEDLVAQPIEQIERVYDELNLGGFETVRPADGSLLHQEGRLQDQSLSASTRVGRGNQPPLGELLPALRLFQGCLASNASKASRAACNFKRRGNRFRATEPSSKKCAVATHTFSTAEGFAKSVFLREKAGRGMRLTDPPQTLKVWMIFFATSFSSAVPSGGKNQP